MRTRYLFSLVVVMAILLTGAFFSPSMAGNVIFSIYIIGVFRGPLRVGDFVYPLVVNLLVIVAGRSNRRVERRVQSLQCADPDLKAEYDSIVCAWERKALPDW